MTTPFLSQSMKRNQQRRRRQAPMPSYSRLSQFSAVLLLCSSAPLAWSLLSGGTTQQQPRSTFSWSLYDTAFEPIVLDVDDLIGIQTMDGFSASQTKTTVKSKGTATAVSSNPRRTVRKKYQRKRGIPETEQQQSQLQQKRQEEYEKIMQRGKPSLWFFEKLFPDPVWDDATIHRDLYEIKRRDDKVSAKKQNSTAQTSPQQLPNPLFRQLYKMKSASLGGNSMMRVWRQPKLSQDLPYDPPPTPPPLPIFKEPIFKEFVFKEPPIFKESEIMEEVKAAVKETEVEANPIKSFRQSMTQALSAANVAALSATSAKVDLGMTRLVEDRVFGIRRTRAGGCEYETSLLGSDEAVKFREGVRLSNPLAVNADRLNYFAKKELGHGRVEEAQELYEQAIQIDPRDGRAYLGLSRCAQRRRDFQLARDCLRAGLANSVTVNDEGEPDRGSNPFLLQALGCLEEQRGLLSEAESLYIAAARSRPSHAAAWVALAQLRTRKLGQAASAGRVCFQAAERELKLAGLPPSAHVYTAWAALEHKKANDPRRARELYQLALDADPKCSAAWLQLGMMEADLQRWDKAQECFEAVLKFDQRNSRVLQAYAIMETRRPDGNSRKAIDLFERALKAKPRDAAVLQAYALFVAKLGDIKSARDLLRRGAEVDKRHAPVWQAWGMMELRHGYPDEARKIFQQGIWSCAQLSGGQSGGYGCARLWQAWGVLEAQEGDYAAARRCFSRALDADHRNAAAITAWTLMEADQLGNYQDARSIFERALKQFPAGSSEKMTLWRAYEVMEQRAGDTKAAQQVYRRSMGETITAQDEHEKRTEDESMQIKSNDNRQNTLNEALKQRSNEFEVVRWDTEGSMPGEVWLNKGSIEGKVPEATMRKRKEKKNY